MPGELITIAQLAKELGVSHGTAKRKMGRLSPETVAGGTSFFLRADVVRVLWFENVDLLNFLGLPVSPKDSYDILVTDLEETDA